MVHPLSLPTLVKICPVVSYFVERQQTLLQGALQLLLDDGYPMYDNFVVGPR